MGFFKFVLSCFLVFIISFVTASPISVILIVHFVELLYHLAWPNLHNLLIVITVAAAFRCLSFFTLLRLFFWCLFLLSLFAFFFLIIVAFFGIFRNLVLLIILFELR